MESAPEAQSPRKGRGDDSSRGMRRARWAPRRRALTVRATAHPQPMGGVRLWACSTCVYSVYVGDGRLPDRVFRGEVRVLMDS